LVTEIPLVEVTLDVRIGTTLSDTVRGIFVRAGQSTVVAVQPAVGVAEVRRPALAEGFPDAEFTCIVVALCLRSRRKSGFFELRNRVSIARVSDVVQFTKRREGAHVLDRAIKLLVNILEAENPAAGKLPFSTERHVLHPHRLNRWIERIERWQAPIAVFDERKASITSDSWIRIAGGGSAG